MGKEVSRELPCRLSFFGKGAASYFSDTVPAHHPSQQLTAIRSIDLYVASLLSESIIPVKVKTEFTSKLSRKVGKPPQMSLASQADPRAPTNKPSLFDDTNKLKDLSKITT